MACDSYHKYAEDVALMKGMGLNSYRCLSIIIIVVLPGRQVGGRFTQPIYLMNPESCQGSKPYFWQVFNCVGKNSARGHRTAKPSEFNFTISTLPQELTSDQLENICRRELLITTQCWTSLRQQVFLIKTMSIAIIVMINDKFCIVNCGQS